MNALEECHARGFLYKSLGNCNDAKQKVSDCLKVARGKRLDENRARARARKEEQEQKRKDLDKSLGLEP
jgi:COX assembly protein 2